MPRRRLESPPPDRLAAVLAGSGRPGAAGGAAVDGWLPDRAAMFPAASLPKGDYGRHRRPAPPGVLTIPAPLRDVRAGPRRLAVAGLLVVLVGAAVLFGVRVAWARASAAPQPVAAHGAPSGLVSRSVPAGFASGAAAAVGTPGAAGALPTAAAVVIVDVVGQVHHPGVVRLPPGSRVLDAVAAAGGALPAADLGHVNLARPLTDGEQIVVPRPGEVLPASGAAGTAGGAAGAGGVVDLNAADLAALDGLPGVGPVLAQRILDWRSQHGRFSTVDELGEVSGIGDKLLAQLKPRVRV